MPIDPRDFEEDEGEAGEVGAASRFREFDCPSCNANNPVDESFGDGAELLCNYCGSEYRVKVTEAGKLRFREL